MRVLSVHRSAIAAASLALVFSAASGCGGGNDARRHTLSIVFVESWGQDVNSHFMKLATDWGRQNNTDVQVDVIPIRELDLKATAWLQAPRGDLALLPQNLAMVNTDKLRDLSAAVTKLEGSFGGFYNIGEQMARLDGTWYNIPYYAWPHVWFYRKDLVDAAGASLPSTLAEAADLAKRLTDRKSDVYGLGIGLGQDEDFSMFLQTIIWAFGGKVVQADGKTVALNSPEVLAAVNYIMDLYRAGAIPPGALGWDGATNNNLFLGKKIAITANALSIDYVAKRRDPTLYQAIAHSAYPAGPAGRFAFVQTFGWVIKKNSQEAETAERFLSFLYDDARLKELFRIGEGAIAPLQKSAGADRMWSEGRYADAINSVEVARPLGWPGPFTRAAAEVFNRRLVNGIFAKVINDKEDPAAAIAAVTEEIRRVYSQ